MSSLPAGEIVATCDNVDESGILLFQVVRFDPKELSPKASYRSRTMDPEHRRGEESAPRIAGGYCGAICGGL
jgi:uncharacterized protein YcfJ